MLLQQNHARYVAQFGPISALSHVTFGRMLLGYLIAIIELHPVLVFCLPQMDPGRGANQASGVGGKLVRFLDACRVLKAQHW